MAGIREIGLFQIETGAIQRHSHKCILMDYAEYMQEACRLIN